MNASRFAIALAIIFMPIFTACSQNGTRAVSSTCELNNQCQSPLVCRLGRCRIDCRANRDCPLGDLCLIDPSGFGSCQVQQDKHCSYASDCATGLVCKNGACTTSCVVDRDCPSGASCEKDSTLARLPDGGVNSACVLHQTTHCDTSYDCRFNDIATRFCGPSRTCTSECNADRDCRDPLVCMLPMHRCALACTNDHECPGPITYSQYDADASVDGSVVMLDAATTNNYVCVQPLGACWQECTSATAECPANYGCDLNTQRCVPQEYVDASHGPALLDAAIDAPVDAGVDLGPIDLGVADAGPQLLSHVAKVVSAGTHSYALVLGPDTFLHLYAWGSDEGGLLPGPYLDGGSGGLPAEHGAVAIPDTVFAWTPSDGATTEITDVATSTTHTCVIAQHHNATGHFGVFCWGENILGEVNPGAPGAVVTAPQLVDVQPNTIAGVALGLHHTCEFLDASTIIQCWGDNTNGQLGVGAGVTVGVPTRVGPLAVWSQVKSIAAGTNNTCAIVTLGGPTAVHEIFCWGQNDACQVTPAGSSCPGVPTTEYAPLPLGFANSPLVQYLDGLSIADGRAASHPHICAWGKANSAVDGHTAGAVYCWGENDQGQANHGATGTGFLAPNPSAPVMLAHDVDSVSGVVTGAGFTCAVTQTALLSPGLAPGGLECWGNNSAGEFLELPASTTGVPYVSSRLSDFSTGAASGNGKGQSSAGTSHVCYINADGGVACWGADCEGQSGYDAGISACDDSIPTFMPPLTTALCTANPSGDYCGWALPRFVAEATP